MQTGILHTHLLVVTLFLLIYVIKTILLLSNKNELLATFAKKTRLFEIIISFLFLFTGIYLLTTVPFGGKFTYLLFIKIGLVFASIPVAVIGFRKSNKALATLSLLMIVGSYGLAESFHKKKGIAKDAPVTDTAVESPATESSAVADKGESLFKANCVLCHGADGKLGANGAKDLSASTMDVAEMKQIILNGKGLMPAAQVDEQEAAAIAEYINNNLKGH